MIEYLETLAILPYVLSVGLASWITIYFTVKNEFNQESMKRKKIIIPLIWGAILGIIWLIWVKPPIDLLILGFFATAGMYDYLIKWIFRYPNKKR